MAGGEKGVKMAVKGGGNHGGIASVAYIAR